jgi:hypothetical protein
LISKTGLRGKLSGTGSAPVRLEQHALDDVGADIACAQVFKGGHGIAAALYRNAGIDDAAPVRICAGFAHGGQYIRVLD